MSERLAGLAPRAELSPVPGSSHPAAGAEWGARDGERYAQENGMTCGQSEAWIQIDTCEKSVLYTRYAWAKK